MNPPNDVVCHLIETPFYRWKEKHKKDLLTYGRPTEEFPIHIRKEKKDGRAYYVKFKSSWFTDCTWLCSSPALEKLFCWPCLLFSNKISIWIRQGFSDFANIVRSLRKHEDSVEHLKCKLHLKRFQKNRNLLTDTPKENARLLTVKFNENVRLNRLIFQRVLDTVLFLISQEITFEDNFNEVLGLVMSGSSLEVQSHYGKIKIVFNCNSKTVQDDIVECVSEYIRTPVISEIAGVDFFSVQVNDALDINQGPQCSLIIKYFNAEGILVERFLGLHQVTPTRSAEAMSCLLHEVLSEFGYENKLVAQSYDGASVLFADLNRLQEKVKEKAPQAVLVNSSHHPSFVLQQTLKENSYFRRFLDTIDEMSAFFGCSARRTFLIMNSVFGRRIPTLSDIRCPANFKLLGVIVKNWDNLRTVFETIIDDEESDARTVRLATTFLGEMCHFEFGFLAVAFNDVLSVTDILFDDLQKRFLDVAACITKIKSASTVITNKRNDELFTKLFELTQRLTRRCNSVMEDGMFKKCGTLFYELLDIILIQITIKFRDYEKLQFANLADSTKFVQYMNIFPTSAVDNLEQCYPHIFSRIHRLQNELHLLYSEETYRNTDINGLPQMLARKRDIFEQTYKLYTLVFTILSAKKLLKNDTYCSKRVKMHPKPAVQERLPFLTDVSVQRELLGRFFKNPLFYEDILEKFAIMKERSIDLLYQK